jgi:hypothetical protein
MVAEKERDNEIAMRKILNKEKKLKKMDERGGMSANDIVNLMNDDKLVDRYTQHLNNILLKY